MQVVHFEFCTLSYKDCFEIDTITFLEAVEHFFVFVVIGWSNWKYKIWKHCWLAWWHFDENRQVVIVAKKIKSGLLLSFNFSKVSRPINDVVFVLLVESHFCGYIVLNHFLTTTVLQKLGPCGAYFYTLYIMVVQRILVDQEIRSAINVVAGKSTAYDCNNYCVYTGKDNRALSNTDVPYLKSCYKLLLIR